MKRLRKVYVNELLQKYQRHEPEKFEGYFHKWFDGKNKRTERPEQIAIIELEDETIKMCALDYYSIRFQTQDELEEILTNKVQ